MLFKVCLGLLAFSSAVAHADVNCRFDSEAMGSGGNMGYTPENSVVNLGGITISVGADIPVGTVVFSSRQSSIPKLTNGVYCDGPFNFVSNIDYLTTPMPVVSWSGPTRVFQTGIPGLSVYLSTYDSKADFPQHLTYVSTISGGTATSRTGYDLSIIKTGPVSPGIVNGSQLPSLQEVIPSTAGYSGLPLILKTLSFTGIINVLAPSCTTPDVTVVLGKHDASEFSGVGSTTPWVNSSIAINNCTAAFVGYYNKSAVNSVSGTGTLSQGTATPNIIKLGLTPVTSIIDSANGVMSLDTSGGNSASGVGIQIGWGSATGNPSLFNFTTGNSFNPPTDGTANFIIPLSARYIQTLKTISPGQANGKITFTIDYI